MGLACPGGMSLGLACPGGVLLSLGAGLLAGVETWTFVAGGCALGETAVEEVSVAAGVRVNEVVVAVMPAVELTVSEGVIVGVAVLTPGITAGIVAVDAD